MQFTDLSHLTPAEAHNKLSYLALKLYMDQYRVNFFIRSPLPEQYLKNELLAYWEGRITEFHGWEDPIGQTAQWIVDEIGKGFLSFWEETISPALNDLFSPLADLVATIYTSVEGIPDFVDFVTDFVGGFSDTISVVFTDAIAIVQDWIEEAVSTIPDLLADPLNAMYLELWRSSQKALKHYQLLSRLVFKMQCHTWWISSTQYGRIHWFLLARKYKSNSYKF